MSPFQKFLENLELAISGSDIILTNNYHKVVIPGTCYDISTNINGNIVFKYKIISDNKYDFELSTDQVSLLLRGHNIMNGSYIIKLD